MSPLPFDLPAAAVALPALLLAMLAWALNARHAERRARRAAEAEARALAEHLARLGVLADEALWSSDASCHLTAVSAAGAAMAGVADPATLIGRPLTALVGPEAARRLRDAFDTWPTGEAPAVVAVQGEQPASGRWLVTRALPRRAADGTLTAIDGATSDRTALQALQAERDNLAATDPATALPTRAPFLAAVERELARARRNRRPPVLLALSLDGLPEGMAAGSEAALRRVAGILAATVRPADAMGRLDANRFAVLLAETSLAAGLEVAERLRAAVAAPPVSGPRLAASLGLAEAGSADDAHTLLHRAEAARARAAASGDAVRPWLPGDG